MSLLQGSNGLAADVTPVDIPSTAGKAAVITYETNPDATSSSELIGSPVTAKAVPIGAKDTLGDLQLLNLDASGNLLIASTSTSPSLARGASFSPNETLSPSGALNPLTGLNVPLEASDHGLYTISYYEAIIHGLIPSNKGFKFETKCLTATSVKQLCNDGLFSETLEVASGGTWTLVSSSNSDSLGGGGAEYIKIEYIDWNGLEQEKFIALTGVTPVQLTPALYNIRYIQELELAGPNGVYSPVGTIDLIDSLGVIITQLLPGDDHASIPTYRTASNKKIHLKAIDPSARDRTTIYIRQYKNYSLEPGGPASSTLVPHTLGAIEIDRGSVRGFQGEVTIQPNTKFDVLVESWKGAGTQVSIRLYGYKETV